MLAQLLVCLRVLSLMSVLLHSSGASGQGMVLPTVGCILPYHLTQSCKDMPVGQLSVDNPSLRLLPGDFSLYQVARASPPKHPVLPGLSSLLTFLGDYVAVHPLGWSPPTLNTVLFFPQPHPLLQEAWFPF